MHVIDAILSRRSIRGFSRRSVPADRIEELLRLAARSPSGGNLQPWKVHVLLEGALTRVARAIACSRARGDLEPEYQYYPESWREPWISRKRKIGWDLYTLAGIKRGDKVASELFHSRNFEFFGAPAGLILTLERDAGRGAWVDIGIFAGTLMLAARGMGLDTCPQAFFAEVAQPLRESLPLPGNEVVVCGIALGFADGSSPLNSLVTEREPVSGFAAFHK